MSAVLLFFVTAVVSLVCLAGEEEWIEESEDPESLLLWLEELSAVPLDLDAARVEELERLPYFSVADASIVVGLVRVGRTSLLDFAEVLNPEQLSSLIRYTTLGEQSTAGRSQRIRIVSRWSQRDEDRVRTEAREGRIRGDFRTPDGYRGFTLATAREDRPDLFDHASAGIEIPGQGLRPRLLFGDYTAEWGTGLISSSSFGSRQWLFAPELTSPPSSGRLRLQASSRAGHGMRGGAMGIESSMGMAQFVFSNQQRDAVIAENGPVEIVESVSSSTELSEAREGQVTETQWGVALERGIAGVECGAGFVQSKFAPGFMPREPEETLPRLTGSEVAAFSSWIAANRNRASLVAEAARSNPGGYAFQGAASSGVDRLQIGIYGVYSEADYFAPHSGLWGEYGEDATNKSRLGVRTRGLLTRHDFLIHGYLTETPFRTATAPLGTQKSGLSFRWRLISMDWMQPELMLERRHSADYSENKAATTLRTEKLRLDVVFPGADQFRIRVEIRGAKESGKQDGDFGSLCFVQWSNRAHRANLFVRLTAFDLESANVDAVAYENNLPGFYPLALLTGSGMRWAAMASRDFSTLTIALHSAVQSRYSQDREVQDWTFGIAIQSRFDAR